MAFVAQMVKRMATTTKEAMHDIRLVSETIVIQEWQTVRLLYTVRSTVLLQCSTVLVRVLASEKLCMPITWSAQLVICKLCESL